MTMLPMGRPVRAVSPRNQMVRGLAQSLMSGQGAPAAGLGGALLNFAKPVAGAYMLKRTGEREDEERKAETSALGRMLRKAEEARRGGGDPGAVIDEAVSAGGLPPGLGEDVYRARLSQMLAGPGERKILEDAAGRQRYADTGEMVFEGVDLPAEPRKSREIKVGDNVVTQEFDPATGSWTEIATSPRRTGPGVEVNLPKPVSEIQGMEESILRNRQKFEETGDPKYARMADRIEMKLTFGGKPPESYVKARNSLGQAREGIAETYRLIQSGQGSSIKPTDRAKVAQSINKARLAYADMLNRGANFTETEQAMIDAMLGGDPNDIAMRALRGDQSYLDGLRQAGEALERRGQKMLKAFTDPTASEFEYPWQNQGQPGGAPLAAVPGAQAPAAAAVAPPVTGSKQFEGVSNEEVLRRLGAQ